MTDISKTGASSAAQFFGSDEQLTNALRHMAENRPITKAERAIVSEAAARIDGLEAQVAEARNEALREAADVCQEYSKDHGAGMFDVHSAECEHRILALMEEPTND